MRDPVNEPLGQAPEARPRRTARIVVAVGLLALAVGAVALLRTVDWRRGGEPFAVARIEQSPGPSAAPAASAATTAKADPAQAAANADQVEADSGVKVVRSGGGGAGGSMIIDVPQALSLRLPPAPDKRLVEKSRFGLLPRVGADGARPADVYARPVFASAKLRPGAPRVALLVGGLGLNPASTSDAIARLPAAVSLGFAPYGDDLDGEAAAAREAGHEILLQSPMEPFTYPADNPGPHTLLTSASDADNLDSLRWQMGRFVGYAGVVNHLGGKFTADARALTPALSEIAARGLFYLDDGSSPRSLAARGRADARPGLGRRRRGRRRRRRAGGDRRGADAAGGARPRARRGDRRRHRPALEPRPHRALERRARGARRRARSGFGADRPAARPGGGGRTLNQCVEERT